MNIILCNKYNFCYFEDYINSIREKIKAEVRLFSNDSEINIDLSSSNNYIFVQNISTRFFNIIENCDNIYLINTEQLSIERSRIDINKYPDRLNIIEYIDSNIKHYKKEYKIHMLPYQVNYREIFSNIYKDRDICIIGTENNIPINRQIIIDNIRNTGISVDIISGFGYQRDSSLFRYKVLLNIGYYPENCNILETFRCDRCIYNKMIVVSDLKDNIDSYYLKDYIVFSDYSTIVNKVFDILYNYTYFYSSLFSNFSLETIENRINDISINTIDKLTR